MRTDLGSIPKLCGEKPATDHLRKSNAKSNLSKISWNNILSFYHYLAPKVCQTRNEAPLDIKFRLSKCSDINMLFVRSK